MVAYIDVHTYGQIWMSPWGFSKAQTRHYRRQEAALKKIKKALKTYQNITYNVGSSAEALCKSLLYNFEVLIFIYPGDRDPKMTI